MASFNLILNSSNVVGSNANTYQYNFIGGNFKVGEDYEICASQITIPYSWFNITTAQTVSIIWPGSAASPYTWTIAAGFYYRSDHYNFAKNGIPVAFFFNGVHEDYHQPGDDVEKIEFDQVQKVGRLVFYMAWDIANRDERLKVDSNKP